MSERTIFCGYAEQYLFGFCDTIDEVRNYNHGIMTDFPKMRIQEDHWSKRRKRYTKALAQNNSYIDKMIGKNRFKMKFRMNNWHRLSVREKNQHSAITCLFCPKIAEFALKKSNIKFITDTQPPRVEDGLARRVNRPQIPRSIQRAVLRDAQRAQARRGVRKDLHALLSTNISLRQYSAKRRRQHGYYANNPTRSHIGRDELYVYDKEKLVEILSRHDVNGDKDLGRRLNGKWAGIGREVGLRRRDGIFHLTINSAQLLQEYSKRLGYSMEITKRRKISFDKHKCGLAVYAGTSAKKIVEQRNRMIDTGEIDIGRPICPISTTITMATSERMLKVYGREIDINDIRKRHLTTMHAKEHSHYVISVWFMYDTAVYKAEEELGKSVQSQVEKPFLHMIGRSKSSIVDQLAYVPERISAIQQSTVPLKFNGRYYNDVIRFYSGDLPARQFESGQAIGGLYPCPCGMPASSYQCAEKIFQPAPFHSLAERVAHFGTNILPSEAYNPATMKQQQLIDELVKRGVRMTYTERTPELRSLFQREMKGIRRAPALLSTGGKISDVGLDNYEIVPLEPLHDLRNAIQHLLEELPVIIYEDKRLGSDIAKFCRAKLGQKAMLRGCDAREYLVDLTRFLHSDQFLHDRQCREIRSTLFALTELQRLAYQLDAKRSSKDVLHAHLMALKFAVGSSNIFRHSEKQRLLFGTPYHSIVCHVPECLRIMSLRSIVAESAERMFHELRQKSNATNKHPENVLTNILTRMDVAMKLDVETASDAFLASQGRIDRSAVSVTAGALTDSQATVLTQRFMQQNKLATIWTLKRVADYVKHGPGNWYSILEDGSLLFKDGPDDHCDCNQPVLAHFRDSTLSSIHEALEKDWDHCKSHANHLGISVLTDLYNEPEMELQYMDEPATEASTELQGDPESENERSDIPIERACENVADPQSVAQSTPSTSTCPEPTEEISHAKGKEQALTNKERILKQIWKDYKQREDVINRHIKARQQVKIHGRMYNDVYKRSLEQVRPALTDIEQKIKLKMKKLELDYYNEHKAFSSTAIDAELELKRQIVAHFLIGVISQRK